MMKVLKDTILRFFGIIAIIAILGLALLVTAMTSTGSGL